MNRILVILFLGGSCLTHKAASDKPSPDASGRRGGEAVPTTSLPNSAAEREDNTHPGPSPSPSVAQDSDDTNGSGGAKGNQSLKASVGLNYMINVPNDNAPNGKSHGLLVLLHGSGASNFREFVRMMSKVATEEGLIPVSVQAPNGRGWNEGNQNNAAELLHRLLQEEILPKYNVNKRKIVFSGQSSGGGFLSSHFVPLHADDYEGGAFLQCGAAPPQAQFRPSDATKKRFRLHFEITSGDPIWPQSYRRAVAAYEAAGMQVSKDESKRGGHCSFDQQQVIRDHIRFVLGET